jgi:hypothetical protein
MRKLYVGLLIGIILALLTSASEVSARITNVRANANGIGGGSASGSLPVQASQARTTKSGRGSHNAATPTSNTPKATGAGY